MATTYATKRRHSVHRRVLEIQASWSADERRIRLQQSKQRLNDLLAFLFPLPVESEILAVGAPVVEDCRRLAS